mmetsp:Transcript_17153/g.51203  ORF Transcript_17153/g.51203 Transcript_17153/m.51203 type:complete len:163 (+) Transcript_17153:178-666(+)
MAQFWPGKGGMDASFRAAAAQYMQKAPTLTHAQRVIRLYRQSLKTQNSWAVDRQVFIAEADKLRAAFDANKNATGARATALLEKGEEKLWESSHPDRYIAAYLPGGSLYMRNPPLPLHVCHDGHVPEGAHEEFRNPDMTKVVEGEKGTVGQVLVDQHSKRMY